VPYSVIVETKTKTINQKRGL